MARQCTVCTHRDRDAIETALLQGGTFREIAERYGPSIASLHRHKQAHMTVVVAEDAKRKEVEAQRRGLNVLSETESMYRRLSRLVERAEGTLEDVEGGARVTDITQLSRELRGWLELWAKVKGELIERKMVLHASPEFDQFMQAIQAALRPYPEAMRAVIEAVQGIGHTDGR